MAKKKPEKKAPAKKLSLAEQLEQLIEKLKTEPASIYDNVMVRQAQERFIKALEALERKEPEKAAALRAVYEKGLSEASEALRAKEKLRRKKAEERQRKKERKTRPTKRPRKKLR